VAFGHSGAETIVFKQSGASRLRGVRSTSEDVAVESIQREGDLVTVKLRTRAGLGLGTFNGHLLLEVDDGDVRTIRFGYRGRVVESAPRNGDRA
jgi:hypothetical protein